MTVQCLLIFGRINRGLDGDRKNQLDTVAVDRENAHMVKKLNMWTKAEVDILCKKYPSIGARGCAALLPEKSIVQVRKKAENMKLRLVSGKNAAWTENEDDIIRRFYKRHGAKYCCDLLNGRTIDTIMARARTLKVTRPHAKKHERHDVEMMSETFTHIWRKAEDCEPPCIGIRCVWDLAYE